MKIKPTTTNTTTNMSPKTVLITGVGRGIGKALAEKFLAENYNVIGTSQTGTVDFEHKNLKVFKLDLSVSESIKKCTDDISSTLNKNNSKIDFLINNAGAMPDSEEIHVIIDKLRKTLEINLIGTIDLTEQIIPSINNSGHIVNISSQAGSISEADILADTHEPYHYPAYKISKAAINMYTRTLAVRMNHEKTGIIVSSVHPGWVRTDMGGSDAPMLPAEAAKYIYDLAISHPETGQFWFKGQKYPW